MRRIKRKKNHTCSNAAASGRCSTSFSRHLRDKEAQPNLSQRKNKTRDGQDWYFERKSNSCGVQCVSLSFGMPFVVIKNRARNGGKSYESQQFNCVEGETTNQATFFAYHVRRFTLGHLKHMTQHQSRGSVWNLYERKHRYLPPCKECQSTKHQRAFHNRDLESTTTNEEAEQRHTNKCELRDKQTERSRTSGAIQYGVPTTVFRFDFFCVNCAE